MPIKHPDYSDIDFKPAIALFDWDQSHDACYFYYPLKIPNNLCPLFDGSIVLIDRYVPYKLAWCEGWADRYYEFHKKFNYCPFNFIPDNDTFNLSNKFNPSVDYLITLNKGIYQFSYLQREISPYITPNWIDEIVTYSRHHRKLTIREDGTIINLSNILNKPYKTRNIIGTFKASTLNTIANFEGYKIISCILNGVELNLDSNTKTFTNNGFYLTETGEFNFPENGGLCIFTYCDVERNEFLGFLGDTGKDYTYFPDNTWNPVRVEHTFTPNSLVVQKLDNLGVYQNYQLGLNNNFFRYSDIDIYFSEVEKAINDYIENKDNYGAYYIPKQSYIEKTTTEIISCSIPFSRQFKDVSFQKFPDFLLEHCALVRANNNKWNFDSFYSDLGRDLSIGSYQLLEAREDTRARYYGVYPYDGSYNKDRSSSSIGRKRSLLSCLFLGDCWDALYVIKNQQSGITNTQETLAEFRAKYDSQIGSPSQIVGDFYTYSINTRQAGGSFVWGFIRGYYIFYEKYDTTLMFYLGCKKRIEESAYWTITNRGTYITWWQQDDNNVFASRIGKSETTYIEGITNIQTSTKTLLEGSEIGLEYEWFNNEEYEELFEFYKNIFITPNEFLKEWIKENVIMPDSIAIKEIHACLGAGEFAYSQKDPPLPAYMHIARKLDYVAKALGINFDLNGEIIPVRQSKHLNRGETIPAGWYLGQFGRNEGGNTNLSAQQGGLPDEERLGIVYEVKGNMFKPNQASGDEEITQGGYILCESLTQLWHIMLQDLDRSLGLQTLGSIAIANPNYNPDYSGNSEDIKTPYWKYNGLGQVILDLMYLASDTNRHAAQANVGSLKAQAVAGEILAALGVPATEKAVPLRVDDEVKTVRYPAFNASGQTVADLLIWILQNLAIQNEGS